MKLNKNSKLENYKIQDLHDDQKDITAVVMYKLQEWFTCVQNENTTNYTSLRLTICGEAGSGKTVLINTLVSLIRQLTEKKFSSCLWSYWLSCFQCWWIDLSKAISYANILRRN